MNHAKKLSYILAILTLLGFCVYIFKAWGYTNSLPTIGDEGTYLYKGYMFARGDFRPFQDYGFWTNKAPLSFLIPGYFQLWFGPGLREGRYYALIVSILTMVGIWVTARRLGGQGWAVLSVWVFALSNAHILFLARARLAGIGCLHDGLDVRADTGGKTFLVAVDFWICSISPDRNDSPKYGSSTCLSSTIYILAIRKKSWLDKPDN